MLFVFVNNRVHIFKGKTAFERTHEQNIVHVLFFFCGLVLGFSCGWPSGG